MLRGKNSEIIQQAASKMNKKQYRLLPKINSIKTKDKHCNESDIVGNSPCPCCGFITIPNNGDALAYICPVCCWEIDLFIQGDNEVSDQNNGLTLLEARINFQQFGAVLQHLKKHCRQPKRHKNSIKKNNL